jgi:hypothetical protein
VFFPILSLGELRQITVKQKQSRQEQTSHYADSPWTLTISFTTACPPNAKAGLMMMYGLFSKSMLQKLASEVHARQSVKKSQRQVNAWETVL